MLNVRYLSMTVKKVKKGDIIAKITGSTRALLKGERTALNIVQHMSGVATANKQMR